MSTQKWLWYKSKGCKYLFEWKKNISNNSNGSNEFSDVDKSNKTAVEQKRTEKRFAFCALPNQIMITEKGNLLNNESYIYMWH